MWHQFHFAKQYDNTVYGRVINLEQNFDCIFPSVCLYQPFLFPGTELTAMTVCSERSVKPRNASRRGILLWKTSCKSCLGKYHAQNCSKHTTERALVTHKCYLTFTALMSLLASSRFCRAEQLTTVKFCV
jgi:hypothetical protein